jgi:hypothetical protein
MILSMLLSFLAPDCSPYLSITEHLYSLLTRFYASVISGYSHFFLLNFWSITLLPTLSPWTNFIPLHAIFEVSCPKPWCSNASVSGNHNGPPALFLVASLYIWLLEHSHSFNHYPFSHLLLPDVCYFSSSIPFFFLLVLSLFWSLTFLHRLD